MSKLFVVVSIFSSSLSISKFYLATIDTTSSSATKCPNPTRCGTCLALAPHTNAYLNVSLIVRWIWSQTSSMVESFRTMSASSNLGSSPFLKIR